MSLYADGSVLARGAPSRIRSGPGLSEFRLKSSAAVGLAGVVLLLPFAVNHLLLGRIALGLVTMAVAGILGAMALVGRKGTYRPWLVFVALTPAILVSITVSFQVQGVIGALWCFPAILVFYFTLPEVLAWIANGALYAIVVPMAWSILDTGVSARVSATLLGVSVFSAIFVHVIASQQEKLEAQAVSDSLTGLHNRVLLAPTLEQAMEQSRRSRIPMTLLGLDIDGFKKINDTFGHAIGDQVLCGIADILETRLRRSDLAFRLGGEEFLIFLYGTGEREGRTVAEEIRSTVASTPLVAGRTVTVSLGVAAFEDDPDWEEWMKRCDDNLYRAKQQGRNQVVG